MRVVFFVSNNPDSYSGGRYHAMLMAEATAAAGHQVTVCTNCEPVFFREFADLPGHGRVELLLSDRLAKMPRGKVDVIVVVPQSSSAPWLYNRALMFARQHGARVVLLNFESPNWFNALSPKPRDERQWDGWVEVSRAADLILSSTAEGTKYAQQFYREVPNHALFQHAYPAINSPTADSIVHPPGRKQIICITRCQPGDVHKGGWELSKAFCPAIQGYTLLLLVGFGEVNDELLGELESQAAQYGAKIEIAHRLTDREKFRRIKQSELMLFLSHFEGYGYPPIEARYCNVPCIVYDLPVLREVSGDDLIYVPRGDEQQLRTAIAAVLHDPQYKTQRSFQKPPPIVTFERYVARLGELYSELRSLRAPPMASVATRRQERHWRRALYRSKLWYWKRMLSHTKLWSWRTALFSNLLYRQYEVPCLLGRRVKETQCEVVHRPHRRAAHVPLRRRIRIAVWPVVLLVARLTKRLSPEFVEWVKLHVFRIREEGRTTDTPHETRPKRAA